MSWASRRRFVIFAIAGAIGIVLLAVLSFALFYKTPSCSDGVQNQGEAGIDCGGPCAYLCTDQVHAPVVLFTKTLPRSDGRADVVASVENTNMAAAKNVPYSIVLYGANQVRVQQVTGTIDLPPASTVPVFVSGIASGSQKAVSAFLTIEASAPKWFALTADSRIVPVVSNTTVGGSASLPRIDANLVNGSVTALTNVLVIVVVHDSQGEVIAASQTIVPNIPAQGYATATFTWNTPFGHTPTTIEVLPVIPLP